MPATPLTGNLLEASPPTNWPAVPEMMTISRLFEIEACPRRWALSNASYPHVWDQRGYPGYLNESAVAGQIVHRALEVLVKALVAAGCTSPQEAGAVQVLKQHGGYSGLLEAALEELLQKQSMNPRVALQLPGIRERLGSAQMPALRAKVQGFVSRLRLAPRPADAKVSDSNSMTSQSRHQLGGGVHTEVYLEASEIHWQGRADLVRITPEERTIVDFKAGSSKPEHTFQLQAYAVLWYRDSLVNPRGLPATGLVLAYPGGDVKVLAPDASELQQLECDLVTRRERAVEMASQVPPPARTGTETCRTCAVRHLCADYWQRPAFPQASVDYVDAEIELVQRQGPSSWQARLRWCSCAEPPKGTSILIVGSNALVTQAPGRVLRVLGARITQDLENEQAQYVLVLGARSETFLVPGR